MKASMMKNQRYAQVREQLRVTLWWGLLRSLLLPYRSLICVLDRTALPVRNWIQHSTDPFPSPEQCLPSCSLKAVSLFGFNMKEGKHWRIKCRVNSYSTNPASWLACLTVLSLFSYNGMDVVLIDFSYFRMKKISKNKWLKGDSRFSAS